MTEQATRYAIVGTGSRATLYVDAICGTYPRPCELVAMCDPSSVRISYHNRRLASRHGQAGVPGYTAGEFGRMLAEQRPDVVIVTTVDAYHHGAGGPHGGDSLMLEQIFAPDRPADPWGRPHISTGPPRCC